MDTTPLENMHHNGARRNDSNAIIEQVQDITTQLQAKGVTNKLPNFVCVDMLNHGTNGGAGEACRRVNELWAKV